MLKTLVPQRIDSMDLLWTSIERDLDLLFNSSATCSPVSIVDKLYAKVEDYLFHKVAHHRARLEAAYERVCSSGARSEPGTWSESPILSAYACSWTCYHRGLVCLNVALEYLNKLVRLENEGKLSHLTTVNAENLRNHMPPASCPRLTVERLGLFIWERSLLHYAKEKMDNVIVQEILSYVHLMRLQLGTTGSFYRPDQQDMYQSARDAIRSYIVCCSESAEDFSFYKREIHAPFMKASGEYYHALSHSLLDRLDLIDYLNRVEDEMEQSLKWIKDNLYSPLSLEPVMKLIEGKLLTAHSARIQAAFVALLNSHQVKDLKRVYLLFLRTVAGIRPLLGPFENWVKETGQAALLKASKSCLEPGKLLVNDFRSALDTLYQVHSDISSLVQVFFDKHVDFEAAIDKAFRSLMNTSSELRLNGPECMARYFDFLLRKKSATEEMTRDKLQQLMRLFKYVDEKDAFQRLYQKTLAKRLLTGAFNEESEAWMIQSFKSICGMEYISRFQKMMMDVVLSVEASSSFRKTAAQLLDCELAILTSGSWPITAPECALPIPDALADRARCFAAYYSTQHNGRKLAWHHSLSRVEMKVNGLDKSYELLVNYHQMALLLLYSDSDAHTLDGLQASIGAAYWDVEYSSALKILIEIGILRTQEDSVVCFNTKFSHPRVRIKVPFSLGGLLDSWVPSDSDARLGTNPAGALEEDRKAYVEALIVRIMKASKELGSAQLVAQVLETCSSSAPLSGPPLNLHFVPSLPLIKKAIEALLAKDYIQLSPKDPDVYLYIA